MPCSRSKYPYDKQDMFHLWCFHKSNDFTVYLSFLVSNGSYWVYLYHPFRWRKEGSGCTHIQVFRERLSEKMCTRQSRKVIWDMIDILFLTTVAVEPTLFLSVSTRKHIFMAFRANSFKFLWRTVNSKPPTMPFRIVAYTSSDNLSRNSCMCLVAVEG